LLIGGRYWDRTSGFYRVKVAWVMALNVVKSLNMMELDMNILFYDGNRSTLQTEGVVPRQAGGKGL
jgi:hypothetical protein